MRSRKGHIQSKGHGNRAWIFHPSSYLGMRWIRKGNGEVPVDVDGEGFREEGYPSERHLKLYALEAPGSSGKHVLTLTKQRGCAVRRSPN